jgi:hypothetical protein
MPDLKTFDHDEKAENHYRAMSAKYVVPVWAYAQEMVCRPYNSPTMISQVLTLMRQLEHVRNIFIGPIDKNMEEELSRADMLFRAIMGRLEELDR